LDLILRIEKNIRTARPATQRKSTVGIIMGIIISCPDFENTPKNAKVRAPRSKRNQIEAITTQKIMKYFTVTKF